MARYAQDAQGGIYQEEMTGFFSVGFSRGVVLRDQKLETGVRYQPSFGHLKGTNVQMSLSLTQLGW